MIPPRSQVINWDVIVNTERFHKREREKRGHYGTPGIRDVERDTLSIIGGRMRCPNNGVGTQEVSMNLSVTWAHRTLGDLSAVRMNETVEPLLAQRAGIALDLVTNFAKRYSHVAAHT